MPIDNSAVVSSNGQSSLVRNPIFPSGVISTSGEWNTVPTNLPAILDESDSTATTEGFVGGNIGKFGYVVLLFPVLQNCYVEFRIGIRKEAGWANRQSIWPIEISANNINWQLAGGFLGSLPSSEQIFVGSISSLDGFRAIRFGCGDVGGGGAHLIIYRVRFFVLACT